MLIAKMTIGEDEESVSYKLCAGYYEDYYGNVGPSYSVYRKYANEEKWAWIKHWDDISFKQAYDKFSKIVEKDTAAYACYYQDGELDDSDFGNEYDDIHPRAHWREVREKLGLKD